MQTITYGDRSFDDFLDALENKKAQHAHHLCLFLGLFDPDKEEAVDRIEKKSGKNVEQINCNDIIHRIESRTFERLDELFKQYASGSDSILYFSNGDKLSGAYTGYSYSKVKYATPQERYFLNKVQAYDGLVIVDIKEFDDAAETIRRAAHTTMRFPVPKSFFRRFWWSFKNYSLHGYDLKTKRPEVYDKPEANL